MSEPYQSVQLQDRKGRGLVSVFVFQDDSFQVVDERKDSRRVVLDTRPEKEQFPFRQTALEVEDS